MTHRVSPLPAVIVMGEWPSSLSSHLGYDNGFARNNLAETNINFARTSFHHWMLLRLNQGLWNGCCSGWTSGTHQRSDSRKGCRNHCWNLESLLVAHHWFGLHTLVIRSIPWCHIHSRLWVFLYGGTPFLPPIAGVWLLLNPSSKWAWSDSLVLPYLAWIAHFLWSC